MYYIKVTQGSRLDKQIVLGVTHLCLLLVKCGCCTVTVQGTFIFLACVKGLLMRAGGNTWQAFAPLVAFQSSILELDPAEREEILRLLAALLPGF